MSNKFYVRDVFDPEVVMVTINDESKLIDRETKRDDCHRIAVCFAIEDSFTSGNNTLNANKEHPVRTVPSLYKRGLCFVEKIPE